jgi:hypothetical protein
VLPGTSGHVASSLDLKKVPRALGAAPTVLRSLRSTVASIGQCKHGDAALTPNVDIAVCERGTVILTASPVFLRPLLGPLLS